MASGLLETLKRYSCGNRDKQLAIERRSNLAEHLERISRLCAKYDNVCLFHQICR
jgi:hypothetical protein